MTSEKCRYCGQMIEHASLRCANCGQSSRSILYTSLPKEFPFRAGPGMLYQNYVIIKEQKIPYESIVCLRYVSQKTSVGVNYLSQTDFSERATVEIHLNNKKEIKLKATDITLTRLPKSVMDFSLLYMLLSDMTYFQRFAHYAESVRENGYFTYDGVRFFSNGILITRKKNKLDIRKTRIDNYGEFFQLFSRNPSFAQKVSKGLKSFHPNSVVWKKRIHGDRTIDTTRDKDVFVALMFQMYRIQFPSWRP